MKILLVEDDREISEMLIDFLQMEGFEVHGFFDGEQAVKTFFSGSYDLVILDLMLPKISGLEVMKRIRKESVVPIIILSAKDTESDKIFGLGLGADDYITKPFSLTEVLARVKANLRRTTQYSSAGESTGVCLGLGDLEMNLESHTVHKKGLAVDLTAKEYEILRLLLSNPKKVYTKAQLYSFIWKDDYLGDENAVNVHISRLRTKIEDDPRKPQYILTVWGIGYKLGSPKE
ncbi:response regulator transcription factor [Clostridium boliviensis]|uniref:Stage 0 sporulation protein A homolog n=1 Tax=Clostridium boliviensis TaxID=318465 RepID=A0ABU4GT67_9CLOT|nr:response regulator transcription factor [Clostridium boliviensis]MDW2800831.1 response regulator transcription factor [Clostridium boliviensis]